MTAGDLRLALAGAAKILEQGERPADSPTHWSKVSIHAHLARAIIHLEKTILAVPSDEDDLMHALCRVLFAAELRERAQIQKGRL